MADVKELDDVSTAIMCMDTLAMDSMDMPPDALGNVEAPGAQSKGGSNADSDAADEGLRTHPDDTLGSSSFQEVVPGDDHELDKTKEMNMDIVENDLEEEIGSDDDEGLMTDPGTPDTPGTPQEEFAQGVDELDETNDMHVDGAEEDPEEEEEEEEQGSDYEPLESDPAADTSLEEAPEDVNGMEDMHVVGAEEEKSPDNEKLSAPFPIIRVKRIIKLDKDIRLVSSDAIALVAQATALFVQSLSSASLTVMLQTKRKTIRGPDVVLAAKSTRQFRECLGNDLAILLEASNEDGLAEQEHGEKQPQQRKSAKKQQLAPPPGRQPITNFFKSST